MNNKKLQELEGLHPDVWKRLTGNLVRIGSRMAGPSPVRYGVFLSSDAADVKDAANSIERLRAKVRSLYTTLKAVGQKMADMERNEEALNHALEESLKLQSHYARLLNMHDGGERRQFDTPREWMDRISEVENG